MLSYFSIFNPSHSRVFSLGFEQVDLTLQMLSISNNCKKSSSTMLHQIFCFVDIQSIFLSQANLFVIRNIYIKIIILGNKYLKHKPNWAFFIFQIHQRWDLPKICSHLMARHFLPVLINIPTAQEKDSFASLLILHLHFCNSQTFKKRSQRDMVEENANGKDLITQLFCRNITLSTLQKGTKSIKPNKYTKQATQITKLRI